MSVRLHATLDDEVKALEFHDVGVSFPAARIPFVKEWIVRKAKGTADVGWFPALSGVSLELDRGKCLGVIGPNGAGKSTLLRVAAGILTPSHGRAVIRGSVAPLIELGTGFDFELSGRENIFFNGALLGRSRRTMAGRAGEIIEFSGLAQFIDLPLRTYSTGMVARLAFSVATAVDADVILIDEILSVGDAAFHERCEARIRSFRDGGRTMFLVSHDLGSIEKLCDEAICLDEGRIVVRGSPSDVVRWYERKMTPHELRHDRSSIAVEKAGPVSTAVPPVRAAVPNVLFPDFDDATFESRYAAATARRIAGSGHSAFRYVGTDALSEVLKGVHSPLVLVATDPVMVPPQNLFELLEAALREQPSASAAVPLANLSEEPRQRRDPPHPYATLRQFENVSRTFEASQEPSTSIEWGAADPGVFLARTEAFRDERRPAREALAGRIVAIAPKTFVNRFFDFSSLVRTDLMARIDPGAQSVLHVGCGAGLLAVELRKRQSCRVTGMETPGFRTAETKKNVDRLVMASSAEEGLLALDDTFDAIVMGERFASIADPAAFLERLRGLTNRGAELVLSVHNIGSWPVVADLLQGRFDYGYAGVVSAGSLRFYTERSLRELLEQNGWEILSVERQPEFSLEESSRLFEALSDHGASADHGSLTARGFYVVARVQS
ncbi:MAG TPA: ATP-binding cassette domain-containing protein [Thermoanaerobaculia bacterium]|nr:ATP-binding cassette domain-containing protein [Thermoanaerobaculia bacterium]